MTMQTDKNMTANMKSQMNPATNSTIHTALEPTVDMNSSMDTPAHINQSAKMQLALQRLEQQLDQYGQELNRYTLEQLTRQPSAEEWSLGQMYQHLIASALYMQLGNMDKCIRRYEQDLQQESAMHGAYPEHTAAAESDFAAGSASASAQASAPGKTASGESIFADGSFPPVRVKVPGVPDPVQPESLEQLFSGLEQVRIRARELAPQAVSVPAIYTEKHPRFGDLTASEWLILIEMHYRHHLHQKRRLDEFLNRSV
ncbi:DinB family protein [Paenibacillus shenyangensis]|uniref:DinB family protein n=1 Tax=Paenibacillus sp. A9 TaxID=1284352 RepID=UPI00036AA2EA